MRKQGLTLIELLVVIAVIGILTALITFATTSIIAYAKTRSCAANLSQIGQALTLYAHDNDDRYPPYTFQGSGTIPAQPKRFKSVLSAYKLDDRQFYCPLDSHARTAFQSESYSHLDTSYAMSIDYYNNGKFERGGFAFSPTTLADPAKVNLFDDMSDLITDGEGKRIRTGPHGLQYNVLRADGSVLNLPIVQP